MSKKESSSEKETASKTNKRGEEIISQTIRIPKELVDKIEKYQIKHFHTTRHSAILSLIQLGIHADENR